MTVHRYDKKKKKKDSCFSRLHTFWHLFDHFCETWRWVSCAKIWAKKKKEGGRISVIFDQQFKAVKLRYKCVEYSLTAIKFLVRRNLYIWVGSRNTTSLVLDSITPLSYHHHLKKATFGCSLILFTSGHHSRELHVFDLVEWYARSPSCMSIKGIGDLLLVKQSINQYTRETLTASL